jgi:hypothetical protein
VGALAKKISLDVCLAALRVGRRTAAHKEVCSCRGGKVFTDSEIFNLLLDIGFLITNLEPVVVDIIFSRLVIFRSRTGHTLKHPVFMLYYSINFNQT